MSSIQKLTKKQKKGLAFRDRKTGKGKRKNDHIDMEDNAVPLMEGQDQSGDNGDAPQVAGVEGQERGEAEHVAEGGEGQRSKGEKSSKGKGKAEEGDVSVPVESVKAGKKRKRTEDEAEEGASDRKQETSKRKKSSEEKASGEEGGKKSKQRYILFVDPPPVVRLLTPKVKGTAGSAQKAKSKGCAFLEFTHRNALQQGLKLHQSTLDGRMINVELTAGGGGKSETRLAKVRLRNKALLGQREERVTKEATKDNSFPNLPSKPQRFSATSGLEQKPQTKKTWAVGDVVEDETHRGGKRHRKKTAKTWGTGVNAIPVG